MLKDISIKTTLRAVALFTLLSMLLYSGIIVAKLSAQNKLLTRLNREIAVVLVNAQEMKFYTSQVQQFISDAGATGNTEALTEADNSAKAFNRHLSVVLGADTVPEHIQKFRNLEPKFERFYSLGKKMADVYITQGRTEGNKLMPEFDKASEEIAQGAADIAKIKVDALKNNLDEVVANNESIRMLTVIIAFAIAVIIAVFMTWLYRKINHPLGRAIAVSNMIATGDLTAVIETGSKDEIGQLMRAMVGMVEKLKTILASIQSSALSVASASGELSASSEQMSRGIAEQSSRATQIATSSTEMSQTVIDVAKNASSISTSASATASIAQGGAEIVDKSIKEVKEISETVGASAQLISSLGDKSKQIGEIVSVIKDIADQTNLLALNAAIEAARAGEQGRGFAVVADEVRKLAERTGKATSQIGEMIGAIQSEVDKAVTSMNLASAKVETGVEDVTRAGDALNRIVESVSGLQSMIQQVATATEELSSVTEAISSDIETVAGVSHETASSSNQIAQSASDLSRLSSDLQAVVIQFKL